MLEWVRVLVRGHMVSVNVCRTRHSLTLDGGEGKFFLAHLIASTSQETFPHGFFPALPMQLSYSVWHCLYEKVYRKGSIHCSFTDSRYFIAKRGPLHFKELNKCLDHREERELKVIVSVLNVIILFSLFCMFSIHP